MKKQSCKKRQQTGSSSHSKKKKQVKKQNCPKSSSGRKNTQNKYQLPVTCGYKEGVLYLKKYYDKQKCIFSEEQWFKPTEFERFGMKEKNKKWRTSILCSGIPLQKLIEDGFLSAPTFKKSRVQDAKKKKSHEGLKKQESHEEIEDNKDDDDEEDDDEAIDMSVFEGPVLPVTCGSDSGILHKYRFSTGRCRRCIRTENHWLTPEDFTKLSKPDGTWKKDIVSHGMPLGKLIKKRVLEPHAVNCDCAICKEPDQNQLNDDVCFVCNSDGELVCCDECPRAFHSRCHLPAPGGDSPGSQWSCTFCVMKNMESSSQKTQQDVLSSPVSQYTLHCQYLLLHLLRESMTDLYPNVPGYSENICGPMMLGRVKMNLANNDYHTVREFITAIEYVFHHCTTNRDNDFSRMTFRLKELFEMVFKPL
ncbi:nuclear body protein SP140-like protein isoform X1 [Cyprinus carpio]|uniref:Nuclear body protein SP140-like protein isoform X1 n=1 Tax=Cyprinus carpio TaxID=7962 RepID=A0A9Q9W4E3_CYPCA|nr:nuclear body protein SP140-like protein isoform X1 [Cyprinus carpio]XP_042576628.1 nuclear body protein SP140-like protein isoform X1 [Cyprinus carpio]XP_042576629.1 nuclear body protein SP140-like protein isoform X1 [Cyprinus carpio]